MKKLLMVAALLAAPAAHANPYVVQSATVTCPSIKALTNNAPDCAALPKGARVEWNGKVINTAATNFANVGRVTSNGHTAFVYSNFLGERPPADPLRRDFTLARPAIGCPKPEAMDAALEATVQRDPKWFAETGCVMIPKGTRTARLSPSVATGNEDFWRMRVRFSHDAAQELWLSAAEFR